MDQTAHPDTCVRCPWIRGKSAEYIAYHDNEWGRPLHDERKLYELFTIELFQAGLSWELLLAKRENFRIAYDGFDPIKVAGYGPADVERLMADKGIVRNRGKIEASISNTNVILDIAQEYGGFEAYLWGFVDRDYGEPPLAHGLKRPQAPRHQVRRPGHHPLVFAGSRHHQRPRTRMLGVPGARRPGSALKGLPTGAGQAAPPAPITSPAAPTPARSSWQDRACRLTPRTTLLRAGRCFRC